jgi:hypothetical protein
VAVEQPQTVPLQQMFSLFCPEAACITVPLSEMQQYVLSQKERCTFEKG